MSPTLAELRATPHLSVAQLKTFIQCPRKYFLQYIERAAPSHRSAALAFGSAWHSTIDEWLINSSQDAPVPNAELHEVFKAALEQELLREGPPVLFDDDQEDLGRLVGTGMRMVDAFVRAVPLPAKVIGVEIPFGLTLVDPTTGEVLPVPLIGSIDALVVEGGETSLWELKSGKRRWSSDQVEYDLQPTAYVQAARELGEEPDAVKLIVATKSSQPDIQVERLVRRRSDEEDLFATAASVVRGVHAGVDHPVRSWSCRTCPYTGACR